MGYGAGVEHDARPTMSMMACLSRLVAVDGRLVRHTRLVDENARGWRVAHRDDVLYWFPTVTGNGLMNRGMIDDEGRITKLGLAAMERHKR